MINVISTIIVILFVVVGFAVSNIAETEETRYQFGIFFPLSLLIIGGILQLLKKIKLMKLIGVYVTAFSALYCFFFFFIPILFSYV
ncbi:hypothetical protein ACM26V_04835 [Salipaludibacillus sp. HK11]|uniref:hypothetical protein n=1 Tax=Salipaludibacillus sp. HK11 TaxID=3394320 RepID=UPI0039FBBFAE